MPHEKYQTCIDECNACATICEHCASACLLEDNVKEMVRCIELDHDCAALCRLAAELMSRGSEFAREICGMCAAICQACAEECKKHSHMQHCKECADRCFRCAEECRSMVAMTT